MSLSEQQAAYVNATGNTVLCACPGSGKTFAVAEKAKQIIKKWNRFHCGIAVLSFTNVAIDEIKKSVNCDETVSYPHFFGTVDSFIDDVYTRFAGLYHSFPSQKPFITLDYIDKNHTWRQECHRLKCDKDISSFYLGNDNKLYKPKNNEEVKCLRDGKDNSTPCRRYKNNLFNRGIVYQIDVPALCTRLLRKHPQIAQAIAKRYPIIIIDEAQDTSKEQMAFFDVLIENGLESIDFVGDPDQSIYEWRNANPESFTEKTKDERWNTLYLRENRRSSQLICNATAAFSSTLEGRKPNVAIGEYKDYAQKPQLYILPKNKEDKDVQILFEEKCKKLDLHDVAILSRGTIHSERNIEGLWKSDEVKLFANAAYEWQYGSKKNAYLYCERAFYIMCIDDFEKSQGTHQQQIESYISYDEWKKAVLTVLMDMRNADTPIFEWVNYMRIQLTQKQFPILFRNGHNNIDDVIKIKRNDKDFPELKNIELRRFFEIKEKSFFVRSSVHGVKGESYDGILLLALHKSGDTITRNLLCEGKIDCEMMRIAYVAMTRPRKYLAVAIREPKDIRILNNRFSTENWEYVFI